MGCPKHVRDRYKGDEDWNAYTEGFLAYLRTQSSALGELVMTAKTSPSCLICFEADCNRCHRMFVARAAARFASFDITHLTAQQAIPDEAARPAA
jgi:hypothetical protein